MLSSEMNAFSSNNPTNSYDKHRFINNKITNISSNSINISKSSSNRRKSQSNFSSDSKRQKTTPKSSFKSDQNSSNNRIETYNFLQDDSEFSSSDLHDLYESPIDNYPYLNENDHQNIVDENSVFIDGDIEEYSIDYIDESDAPIIDCFNYVQYPDGALFNHPLLSDSSPFVSSLSSSSLSLSSTQPVKSKRKQGIVGRPTLSSPQRLLVPDNVYSRGNPIDTGNDNYFTDNNYRNNNHRYSGGNTVRISVKRSSMKPADQAIEFDDVNRYSGVSSCRNRPRILTKPIVQDSMASAGGLRQLQQQQQQQQQSYSNLAAVPQASGINTSEQDALELAQRTVANREFARNLVKRAERQGTVIDKNKIPMSVFEQQPVEALMKSALDEQLLTSAIAEIKETEQFVVSQPFTTTVNVGDGRRLAGSIARKSSNPQLKPPHNFTASDLLKQKWKAANRQQS